MKKRQYSGSRQIITENFKDDIWFYFFIVKRFFIIYSYSRNVDNNKNPYNNNTRRSVVKLTVYSWANF